MVAFGLFPAVRVHGSFDVRPTSTLSRYFAVHRGLMEVLSVTTNEGLKRGEEREDICDPLCWVQSTNSEWFANEFRLKIHILRRSHDFNESNWRFGRTRSARDTSVALSQMNDSVNCARRSGQISPGDRVINCGDMNEYFDDGIAKISVRSNPSVDAHNEINDISFEKKSTEEPRENVNCEMPGEMDVMTPVVHTNAKDPNISPLGSNTKLDSKKHNLNQNITQYLKSPDSLEQREQEALCLMEQDGLNEARAAKYIRLWGPYYFGNWHSQRFLRNKFSRQSSIALGSSLDIGDELPYKNIIRRDSATRSADIFERRTRTSIKSPAGFFLTENDTNKYAAGGFGILRSATPKDGLLDDKLPNAQEPLFCECKGVNKKGGNGFVKHHLSNTSGERKKQLRLKRMRLQNYVNSKCGLHRMETSRLQDEETQKKYRGFTPVSDVPRKSIFLFNSKSPHHSNKPSAIGGVSHSEGGDSGDSGDTELPSLLLVFPSGSVSLSDDDGDSSGPNILYSDGHESHQLNIVNHGKDACRKVLFESIGTKLMKTMQGGPLRTKQCRERSVSMVLPEIISLFDEKEHMDTPAVAKPTGKMRLSSSKFLSVPIAD